MKFEPDEKDEKISILYIIAYSLFLLVPFLALYKGIQSHNVIAIVGSVIAILGFSFLLTISIRHNKKIDKKRKN